MASPAATVTSSINSMLDKSVPPASSEDRLSFLSVFRDGEGRNMLNPDKQKPHVYFRAISPHPVNHIQGPYGGLTQVEIHPVPRHAVKVMAPRLGQAKSRRPMFYQQMALSECNLDKIQSTPCLCHLSLSNTCIAHRGASGEKGEDRNQSASSIEELDGSQELDCSLSGEEALSWNDLCSTSDYLDEVNVELNENTNDIAKPCQPHSPITIRVDNSFCESHQRADNSKESQSSCPTSAVACELPVVVKEESSQLTRKPDYDIFTDLLMDKARSRPQPTRNTTPRLANLVTTLSFDLPNMAATVAKEERESKKSKAGLPQQMSEGSLVSTSVMPRTAAKDQSKKVKDSKKPGRTTAGSGPEQPTDEDYKIGVTYSCKYIGSMSMMKPSTKTEILGAMRRVRFEYKTRNTKKKKVMMEIGVGGVKVLLNKKRQRGGVSETSSKDMMLMEEPICHIFFVSHDSQDNLIFSYISRKNSALSVKSSAAQTNIASQQSEPTTFHCHVFKAYKRAQAVLIVHGLGRIFELCHDIPNSAASEKESRDHCKSRDMDDGDISCNQSCDQSSRLLDDSVFLRDNEYTSPEKICRESAKADPPISSQLRDSSPQLDTELHLPVGQTDRQQRKLIESKQKSCDDLLLNRRGNEDEDGSTQQEIRLLWLQLEQQENQIEIAVGQTELLRQQVAIETQARNDAEMRCHQLLLHNKDLLEHINKLALENKQLRDKLNQVPSITEPILASSLNNNQTQGGEGSNHSTKTTSPDSGHKEMSSKSSHSDILEEWEKEKEKLNMTLNSLTTPSNSSYQLTSKFETEKLQKNLTLERELSFTDMAKLRASQSQLSKSTADQSHTSSHYASNRSMVMSQPPNISKNGVFDNQSASSKSTTVIPLRSKPNGSKLLCTLMVSEHEMPSTTSPTIRTIPHHGTQSSSISRSVNDIYEKMKVIRKSLESIEPQLSSDYHNSKLASSPASEFTPQRTGKSSVTSSTPTSQVSTGRIRRLEEHLYADISELKQDVSDTASHIGLDRDSSLDRSPLIPSTNEKDTPLDNDHKHRGSSRSTTSSVKQLKQRHRHDYENVAERHRKSTKDSQKPTRQTSLSRSDTYVVHRSAFDLHKSSISVDRPEASKSSRSYSVSNGKMSQSCQSLSRSRTSLSSLRYTNAPQKVTTLFSPPAKTSRSAAHTGSASRTPSTMYYSQIIGASHKMGIHKPRPPETTDSYPAQHVTSFPVIVRPIEKGLSNGRLNKLRSSEFQPISSQPALAISRDSLNSSTFEAELDRRLDRLVGLHDSDWG